MVVQGVLFNLFFFPGHTLRVKYLLILSFSVNADCLFLSCHWTVLGCDGIGLISLSDSSCVFAPVKSHRRVAVCQASHLSAGLLLSWTGPVCQGGRKLELNWGYDMIITTDHCSVCSCVCVFVQLSGSEPHHRQGIYNHVLPDVY